MSNRLDIVLAAWRLSPASHQFRDPATDEAIAEAERSLGRAIPDSLKSLYRFANGMSALGGNLGVESLLDSKGGGLVYLGDRLRSWHWPIPEEVLMFGGNGADEQFGLWYPPGAPADGPMPVVMIGSVFEAACLALAGTDLPRFLLAWSGYYLVLDEAPTEALDALGLPEALRRLDEDASLAAYVGWADPALPDHDPDPYSRGVDAFSDGIGHQGDQLSRLTFTEHRHAAAPPRDQDPDGTLGNMEAFSDFERSVLNKALSGDDPILATLREQAHSVQVTEREFTGVGFFLTLAVGDDVPLTDPRNFEIGDVWAEIDGVEHGATFVLFIRDGRLDLLEGVTIDGPWPEPVGDYRLSFDKEPRDIEFDRPASDEVEALYRSVETDPERAWSDLLGFAKVHPQTPATQALIEEFVYKHGTMFIARLEAAALADPAFREQVEQAYVGGDASRGAQQFHELQERLTSGWYESRDGPVGGG